MKTNTEPSNLKVVRDMWVRFTGRSQIYLEYVISKPPKTFFFQKQSKEESLAILDFRNKIVGQKNYSPLASKTKQIQAWS